MDPNVLRVMTDPAARNDPALLRQAMNAMHAQSRRSVLSSVRLNSVMMGALGYLALAAALGVSAAATFELVPAGAWVAALVLAAVGGLFVFLARLTALPPRSLLKHGVKRQALVREVKALGRTIGIEKPGISATLSKVTVVLTIPELSGEAFEHREYVLGGDLARLQVGSSIPVRCDPKRPQRLAIDWEA